MAEIALVDPDRLIETDIELHKPVDCDRVRLGQLLSNLLGNAVMYGAKSELIIVRAAMVDEALTISVTNDGQPIEEAARRKLFQTFFRGDVRPNQTGLGLGLHIASEMAKAPDGTIAVSSDTTKACFAFEMPLAASQPNPVSGCV